MSQTTSDSAKLHLGCLLHDSLNPVYWVFCRLAVRYEPQHFTARFVGIRKLTHNLHFQKASRDGALRNLGFSWLRYPVFRCASYGLRIYLLKFVHEKHVPSHGAGA
jgi:hypothetical protein